MVELLALAARRAEHLAYRINTTGRRAIVARTGCGADSSRIAVARWPDGKSRWPGTGRPPEARNVRTRSRPGPYEVDLSPPPPSHIDTVR